jgi:2-polyprenyl-3-methyl-5-hydroxy-6-metoxy-1,4-benzoquinol methylase
MSAGPAVLASDQYRKLWDPELDGGYPANHFAFRHVVKTLHDNKAQRMVEIGVGQGRAISIFTEAGIELHGLDIDPAMVETSTGVMEDLGLPTDRVTWGDIEDSISLSAIRKDAPFDALLAMGVLPHVTHDQVALENMRQLIKPGGMVFVECRNKLFSLITFNRFTYEFIMDDLLDGVSGPVKDTAGNFLRSRVDTDIPTQPAGHAAKYHNPLEIHEVFEAAGFVDIRVRPFHYHAAMPRFEKELGAAFRADSIALENEPSSWRGLFLCSAFIVEAYRPLEAFTRDVTSYEFMDQGDNNNG